jgi:hypothetical protein
MQSCRNDVSGIKFFIAIYPSSKRLWQSLRALRAAQPPEKMFHLSLKGGEISLRHI